MKTSTFNLWVFLALLAMLAVCLLAPSWSYSQDGSVTAKLIEVSWSTEGAEADVAWYQLYSGDSDTTLTKYGERVAGGPSSTNREAQTLQASVPFVVPVGEERSIYFAVTAIDTSGNESGLSAIVSSTVDNKPPAAPGAPTIKVVIPVVTQ